MAVIETRVDWPVLPAVLGGVAQTKLPLRLRPPPDTPASCVRARTALRCTEDSGLDAGARLPENNASGN